MSITTSGTERANRLQATRRDNQMVTAYWEDLFCAPEEGRLVCWFEGIQLNPIPQAVQPESPQLGAALFALDDLRRDGARARAGDDSGDETVERDLDEASAALQGCAPACAAKTAEKIGTASSASGTSIGTASSASGTSIGTASSASGTSIGTERSSRAVPLAIGRR
jgi:hypothetical protein